MQSIALFLLLSNVAAGEEVNSADFNQSTHPGLLDKNRKQEDVREDKLKSYSKALSF